MTTSTLAAHDTRATSLGIACGIGAGALWGLVFLAPELVRGFSPLMLTSGRYLAYGLIAALLISPRWRTVSAAIGAQEWRRLAWLALTGNTFYYVLLATAVQMGGIAMTSLVIGFLPVAVTIVGSRDHGAVPFRKLALSLLLCVAGAVCIGWQSLGASGEAPFGQRVIGLLCAIGALASWTTYAVGNARSLAQLKSVSAHDWTLLTGLTTGAQSLLLVPLALAFDTSTHASVDWLRFAGVCAGLAILASIAGGALWNRMSRLLPLTLVGQMILFETIFALIYGFFWEQRWPTVYESVALVLVIASVLTCLAAHRRPQATGHP